MNISEVIVVFRVSTPSQLRQLSEGKSSSGNHHRPLLDHYDFREFKGIWESSPGGYRQIALALLLSGRKIVRAEPPGPNFAFYLQLKVLYGLRGSDIVCRARQATLWLKMISQPEVEGIKVEHRLHGKACRLLAQGVGVVVGEGRLGKAVAKEKIKA